MPAKDCAKKERAFSDSRLSFPLRCQQRNGNDNYAMERQ